MFSYNKKESDVNGLSFIPDLPGQNDEDFINNVNGVELSYKHGRVEQEFSINNQTILINVIKDLKVENRLNTILEIGVNRSGERSSTRLILDNKENAKYIGVDVNKTLIDSIYNLENNCYGIVEDSSNTKIILDYLNSINVSSIDLFMIDGYHSINQVIRDWAFTNILAVGGYVLLHDTNYHPGPYCVYDAIDTNFYEKKKFFTNLEFDWGIAKAKKIKEYS